jgi:NADH-quinone oxidoreductase subunit L
MPTAGLLLLIAMLLPLASCLLLAVLGGRMGRPLAGWVATALVAGSAACSLGAMIAWFNGGQLSGLSWGPGDNPIEISNKWLPIGAGIGQDHAGFVDVVIYIDSLTIALFNAISLVGLLVHAYAVAAEAEDENFSGFFTELNLLIFGALALALSGSLLQIFVCWQVLSVATFLLNAFRNDDVLARREAMHTFLVGATADVGFLLALVELTRTMGNLTISDLSRLMHGGVGPGGTPIAHSTQTIIGVLLVISAAAKMGVFPFRRWQTSAAHAPAAGSALLQTVAGTAAGTILLARVYPLLTPAVLWAIIIIGVVSFVLSAMVSIVQRDVDQVLAWGTTSQMGLMFLALGIGSWIGALFQLFSHIFFKSLLFLSEGNVLLAAEGRRDLGKMGGLMRLRPLTAATMGVGAIAMAGVPFTCGYFSQEMVLSHAGAFAMAGWQAHHAWWYWIFFAGPMVGVGAGAMGIARCWMLIFWGKPRAMTEYVVSDPRTMLWLPLAALATLSIIGGSRILEIKPMLAQAVSETESYCFGQQINPAHPSGSYLQAWPVDTDEEGRPTSDPLSMQMDAGARLFRSYFPWSLGVGLGLGFLLYLRGFAAAEVLLRFPPLRFVHSLLVRRFMLDEVYGAIAAVMAAVLDRVGAGIESSDSSPRIAGALRRASEGLRSTSRSS